MAKRSDFAQKLLDDIRLRKERLGLSTPGQHSAQQPSANINNTYGNSRRSFRGSAEVTGSRYSNKNVPNTRHHRTSSFEGASQEIIPIGRTRSKEQSIDVSMALALALSNSGMLQNIERLSNGLVGKNLMLPHGYMLRSSDQFPFVSPFQIGDVSKGVQQLNMILRACSNGVIISRDAIDIGRELLKGAMDLEESLRMLVSLQDASDYMAGCQRKKIKLLKGKEDESSSEKVNTRKLIKPRFSFDKASKYREISNSDLGQSSTAPKLNSKKSSSITSHIQSLSSGPSSRPDAQVLGHANKISRSEELESFSNSKHSRSKGGSACEKVRIPNVVAKLMGLEELPLATPQVKKTEVQDAPIANQVKGSSRKEVGPRMHSEPKMKGQNTITEEKEIAETKLMNALEAVHSKAKKNMNEMTNLKYKNPVYSEMPHLIISKHKDMVGTDRSKELKVAKKEATETAEKVKTMQQACEGKVQQGAVEKSTSIYSRHEKVKRNKNMVPKQRRNEQEVNPTVPQKQSVIHRLKTKHQNREKIEQNKRNKLQPVVTIKKEIKLKNEEISATNVQTQNVSSSTSITIVSRNLTHFADTKQPKEYPIGNYKEQKMLENRTIAYLEAERISEDEISEEKRHLKTVAKTEKGPEQNAPVEKVEVKKLFRGRNEKKGIIEEDSKNIKNTEMKVPTLGHNTMFLNELKHRWKEQKGKAETAVSYHTMVSDHHSQQATEPTNLLCSSDEMDIPMLADLNITTGTNMKARQEEVTNPMQNCITNHKSILDSAALHPPEVTVNGGQELQPVLEENNSEGPANRRQLTNCDSQEWKHIATSEVHNQRLLTNDENTLKQILVQNQHFLNAAQALFKIKIPIGVLQATENTCQNEVDKLFVETGYELMRRKGKREEALVPKRTFSVPANVTCLDDLIKELKDDLRSLEFPSETEGADNDIAEYLHKIIERDIENRNPDVNCMWDICWNSKAFANIEKEEIIKDVEKRVLNGLINELARDLMSANISI